jgi:hypothetical protein
MQSRLEFKPFSIPPVLIAFGVCVVLLLATSLAARAGGNPDRQPLGPGPDVTINCPQGYSGVLHDQVNSEYLMTFVERDGTVIWRIDGRLLETFTGNGKVLSFNGSGPGTITFFTDGSVSAVFQGLTVRVRANGLWVYTGRVSVDPATGNILSHSGTIRDICAELA